jgi:hypothetical protein
LQLITHNENHHTLRIILNKFGYYVYKQQF